MVAPNIREAEIQTARYFNMFQRAGMIGNFNGNFRLASVTELDEALKLVENCFVQAGYIQPSKFGMRVRPYDVLPEMDTFLTSQNMALSGVMSVLPDSELGLPSDHVFEDEINSLRKNGSVAEITNLALDTRFRKTPTLLELVRGVYADARTRNLDYLFISICPGHTGAFTHLLGFQSFGIIKNYSQTPGIEDPVEAMVLNMKTISTFRTDSDRITGTSFFTDFFITQNPYLRLIPFWRENARREFYNPDILRQLVVDTEAINSFSEKEKELLQNRWGKTVYEQVTKNLERYPQELIAA